MTDVTTHDGRTLRVYDAGDPTGVPVVVHHGSPMSGELYEPHAALAEAEGVRLIGYDRPGYGGSTTHQGRSVADAAADVRAIAAHFGLERLTTWGISGGGPHALACAALLPGLVAATASLAAVAPFDAEGLDWTAGMGEENLDEFGAVLEGGATLDDHLARQRADLLQAEAGQLLEAWATLLAPVDREALTGEFAEHVVASAQGGWRPASTAGATTTSRSSGTGASPSMRSRRRSSSGTASTTCSSRSRTASGSPRASAASRPASRTTTGT